MKFKINANKKERVSFETLSFFDFMKALNLVSDVTYFTVMPVMWVLTPSYQ